MCDEHAPSPEYANRGALSTEQPLAASTALDALPIEQVMRVMNEQDMKVAQVVHEAIPAIARFTEAVVAALRRQGRLIYLGAGTSGRLGVLDAAECPPTFHSDPEQVVGLIAGGDAALRRAVEGAEDDASAAAAALDALNVGQRDVVLGIAAGGTTRYVWGGLERAKQCDAVTGLLTCVPLNQLPNPDALKRLVDHAIALPVGPEVVTGSTRLKAGTATKMALNLITTTSFVQRGKVWGNLMVDLRATNAKLRDRSLRILTQQGGVGRDRAAELLAQAEGRVKVALVMARLGVTASAARRRLDEADGRLRAILGPPEAPT